MRPDFGHKHPHAASLSVAGVVVETTITGMLKFVGNNPSQRSSLKVGI